MNIPKPHEVEGYDDPSVLVEMVLNQQYISAQSAYLRAVTVLGDSRDLVSVDYLVKHKDGTIHLSRFLRTGTVKTLWDFGKIN